MSTRILTRDDVVRLLPITACIEQMAAALKAVSASRVVQPLRTILRLPGQQAFFGVMPAYAGDGETLGAKLISVFPENHGTALASHQGVIVLFSAADGRLEAIIDAAEVTAIRTAAASAVATDALARPEATTLAILGSGVQAASHLDAMCAVRHIRRLRVWSRSTASARRFVDNLPADSQFETAVCDHARDAVAGADIVCTVTASPVAVLRGEWLSPGCHINAVGACTPTTRELDSVAVQMSTLYTDCYESLFNEAGDFLLAEQEGAITREQVAGEIGEVLLGKVRGRQRPEEITLFKSLGIAAEDLAAASFLLQQARGQMAGLEVEFGT